MALFFDQKWFNEQLEVAGLSKPDLARALGLTTVELAEMWKDQREISDRELGTMALLLGASEEDVRKRGGVQGSPAARAVLKGAKPVTTGKTLEARVDRIESLLEDILERLKDRP